MKQKSETQQIIYSASVQLLDEYKMWSFLVATAYMHVMNNEGHKLPL